MIMPEVLIDLVEEFFGENTFMNEYNWDRIIEKAEKETADRMATG